MRTKLTSIASCLLLASLAVFAAACGDDDPTSNGGTGTAKFTTWGEDFIETGIPANADGENGFIDGWSVKYSKFLVVFGGVTVTDQALSSPAYTQSGTILVNNVNAGVKELFSFPAPARAYDRVSYQIVPATADTTLVGVDAADHDFMVQNKYRLYVEGTATKGTVSKTFKWGFTGVVSYTGCKSEDYGKETEGIVVTNGGTDTTQLTTHGDHLFYNRLQADPAKVVPTTLHFDPLASADDADTGNQDGEVTLEELAKVSLSGLLAEPYNYNPSGLPATNLRALVEELSRTVGHFRGEGECTEQ